MVRARPAPHGAGVRGGAPRFGLMGNGRVRCSTAVPDSTAVRHDRSAKASGLGQSPEGFLPKVSPTRPRPSPTQRLSDKHPQDTTEVVKQRETASRGIQPDIARECAPSYTEKGSRLSFTNIPAERTCPRRVGQARKIERLSPGMPDTGRGDHPGPSRHSLDAADEVPITRTSGLPGRRSRHQHGERPRTMASSTSKIDIASPGTYPTYLATRLDGLRGAATVAVAGRWRSGPSATSSTLTSAHSERPPSSSRTTKSGLR